MDVRRKHVWLAVAGCAGVISLLAGLMITQRPAPHRQTASLPGGWQMTHLDASPPDEAMMQPLRLKASAALDELKAAGSRRAH
jgi:hypothetical protein